MRRGPHRLGQLTAVAAASITIPLLCACGDSEGDAESPSTSISPTPTVEAESSTTSSTQLPVTSVPATSTTSNDASPAPDDMCDDGQVPQAAAYDLDDGSFRWVSCAEGNAYRFVRAVTDDAVYVQSDTGTPGGETIALDPADGRVLPDVAALPPDEFAGSEPIEVDGLTVTGGQDDPTTVHDANGNELWSRPGSWAYDDVWAIDDGAVFAIERDGVPRLVAYELTTGEIRWEHVGDPYAEGLWPWHAEDGRLFTVWDNLQVRDTSTGDVLWTTSYPPSRNRDLRISGVDVDDQAVYAGFGSAPSGGD